MKGFIGWMRRQPEYADLAEDAGPCGSLKGLIQDMMAHSACPAAWRMLFSAIYTCPLPLPTGWHRDAFRPCVDDGLLSCVVRDYVYGPTPGADAMSDREFQALAASIRVLWRLDPHGAETVIDAQRCSSMQCCLLWGLQP